MVADDVDQDDAVDLAITAQASNRVAVLLNSEGQYVVKPTSGDLGQGHDFGNFTALPDLNVAFGTEPLTGTFVPGDRVSLPIIVRNLSNGRATGEITVRVYVSVDNSVDAGDFLLASIDGVRINLAMGALKRVLARVTFTGEIPSGAYFLLLHVDVDDAIAELREDNNELASPQPFQIVHGFGTVGTRHNVRLILRDLDGSKVTYRLRGVGIGEVVENGELVIAGTNASSGVNIRVRGGDRRTTLGKVTVSDEMAFFTARGVDLIADFTAASLKALTLGNVAGQNVIRIGEPAQPNDSVRIRLGRVEDASVISDAHISRLLVVDWRRTDDLVFADSAEQLRSSVDGVVGVNMEVSAKIATEQTSAQTAAMQVDPPSLDTPVNLVSAPSIGQVRAAGARDVVGNFAADLLLAGTVLRKRTLGTANIGGSLDGVSWLISGEGGNVIVKNAVENSSIRTTGSLNSLTAVVLRGSTIFAGIAATVFDLPSLEQHFVNPQAAIRRVTVRGAPGINESALVNSNLAAAYLQNVVLGRIDGDNDGNPFGLAARNIGTFMRRVETGMTRFSRLVVPSIPVLEMDFMIRVI